jgi:hypothetical protein
MGLPTGQDVAKALQVENPLRPDEIIANGAAPTSAILLEYGFDQETPLWFYILKEAEKRKDGRCLGEVGSRLITEVIIGSLCSDPNSYLSIDRKWKPFLLTNGKPVNTIKDLLSYANGH